MKFHPDVLAAHAQFGGDLESMQKLYEYPELKAEVERLRAAQRSPSPVPNVGGGLSFWIWRIPGGDWQVSETEPSASGAAGVDCYQTGATPVRRIEVLELALKPFADIAPCVEYTDKRDGDIVHRQDVVEDGRRVGWKELTKDDFRRAAAAISPSPVSRAETPHTDAGREENRS